MIALKWIITISLIAKCLKIDIMEKFRYNSIIGYLEIDPRYLENGLSYAQKHLCHNIRIISLNHDTDENCTLDFSPFKDLIFIKKLIIADNFRIKKIENIPYIESMSNLSYLQIDTELPINLSDLTCLEGLSIKGDKVISGLDHLSHLKFLQIFSSRYENLYHLSHLKSLDELILNGGKIESLSGIPSCRKLKLLNCRKLTDIGAIDTIELDSLHIERCSKLYDISILSNNNYIRELDIDTIQTLEFIPTLKNLRKLKFFNCIDGDLKPLLECGNLKDIYFYPNRHHYTHSLIELTNLFQDFVHNGHIQRLK